MTDICQYCGHKLTDGKCLNPACRGRLRKEEDVYMGRACPPNCPGNISTSAPAEVEELLERYESSWWLLGYEAASHEDYEISEENWAKMNALKSRLLAAFSNTTPYLSQDVKGVYKYEIDSPDELDVGLHGFRDEVTVIVDSGEPGGDPTGEDSFEEYMRQALIEWYDGAKVVVKKAGE